jgi:D-alanine--poly(phosphoribitol) ligase subunit 2
MPMCDRVRRIVEVQFEGRAHLDIDDDLWELGMTSLMSVGLMIAVEEEFGFELPDEVLDRRTFSSIRRLAGVIESSLLSARYRS